MTDLIKAEQKGFMQFNRLDEAHKYCDLIAKSSFCPTAFSGKAGDVLVAIQMGMELGLQPMQALQNIAVIKGRPSLWGDAMLAVCKAGSDFEYCHETYDEETSTATCTVKRRGEPEQVRAFSKEDAILATLWGKQGPWTQYPKRMLQMRARSFALRDVFPHLLRGFTSAEEAQDIPAPKDMGEAPRVAPVSRLEAVKMKAMERKKATAGQVDWLIHLIDALQVPQETIDKWLERARVSSFEEMDVDTAAKCIEHLEEKLGKLEEVG